MTDAGAFTVKFIFPLDLAWVSTPRVLITAVSPSSGQEATAVFRLLGMPEIPPTLTPDELPAVETPGAPDIITDTPGPGVTVLAPTRIPPTRLSLADSVADICAVADAGSSAQPVAHADSSADKRSAPDAARHYRLARRVLAESKSERLADAGAQRSGVEFQLGSRRACARVAR